MRQAARRSADRRYRQRMSGSELFDGHRRPAASRLATTADLGLVLDTLAQAFAADPVMNWLCRGGTTPEALEAGFGLPVSGMIGCGETRLVDGGSAVAVWMPPGARPRVPLAQWLPNVARAGHALRRFRPGRLFAMRNVPLKHPKAPHWYLFAVGVRPDRQGQGLGGAVLRETLEAIDAAHEAAYLENSNPRNTRLYERLGFETFDSVRGAPDGPEVLLMWRKPR
jgi:ribosomal protein S18 acetylase RimI-like enzyme